MQDMDTNPNKYDVVDYSGGANERDEKYQTPIYYETK